MEDILIGFEEDKPHLAKGIDAALQAFATHNPGMAEKIKRRLEQKHKSVENQP